MLAGARHSLRLLVIATTLARYDALFPLAWLPQTRFIARLARLFAGLTLLPAARGKSDGQRLALALTALGPSFIKLGQALSTRSDLIGAEMAADLSALQDRLPPFDGAAARATIAETLGGPVDTLFASFDDEPVAAASIAQVHFASVSIADAEPQPVAVKVLRPGVEQAFARDLALFRWLARLAERHRALQRLKPTEVVETFAESVRIEMDLRMEAAAAAELQEDFRDEPIYRVPSVDWQRTGQRVLTTERIDGVPVYDIAGLAAAGFDSEEIVRRAASVFFRQVFEYGFFHADMHPGNLFVGEDGVLLAVDFGIMGRLDRATRNYLADMLLGFLDKDYRRVAEVHFRAGYVPQDKSMAAFSQALRSVAEPILGRPIAEISIARLLAQLFQITKQFDMETQPQLLLLQKTMLLAEGVGRQLAPQTNMWLLAEPLIRAWMRENRGPEAQLAEVARDGLETIARLPQAVRAFEDVSGVLGRAVTTLENGRNSAPPRFLWPLAVLALAGAVVIAALA